MDETIVGLVTPSASRRARTTVRTVGALLIVCAAVGALVAFVGAFPGDGTGVNPGAVFGGMFVVAFALGTMVLVGRRFGTHRGLRAGIFGVPSPAGALLGSEKALRRKEGVFVERGDSLIVSAEPSWLGNMGGTNTDNPRADLLLAVLANGTQRAQALLSSAPTRADLAPLFDWCAVRGAAVYFVRRRVGEVLGEVEPRRKRVEPDPGSLVVTGRTWDGVIVMGDGAPLQLAPIEGAVLSQAPDHAFLAVEGFAAYEISIELARTRADRAGMRLVGDVVVATPDRRLSLAESDGELLADLTVPTVETLVEVWARASSDPGARPTKFAFRVTPATDAPRLGAPEAVRPAWDEHGPLVAAASAPPSVYDRPGIAFLPVVRQPGLVEQVWTWHDGDGRCLVASVPTLATEVGFGDVVETGPDGSARVVGDRRLCTIVIDLREGAWGGLDAVLPILELGERRIAAVSVHGARLALAVQPSDAEGLVANLGPECELLGATLEVTCPVPPGLPGPDFGR